MTSNCSKKLPVLFTSLSLTALVFVVVFGMSHAMAVGMEMKGDGTMSGCLFDGRAEICPMTISKHLSRWQGMFTAIPQKTDLLIQFILLAFASVLLAFTFRQRLLLLFSYFSDRWRLYLKQNPHLPLFNQLIEAFSRGILNPKIYESATL